MKHPFTKLGKRSTQTKTSSPVTSRNGLSFGLSMTLLVLAGIGLLASSGYYWYNNVLTDPTRTMSDVLDKSLQTTSVYRTIDQTNNQNSVTQSLYLSFTPKIYAKSVTHLEESGSAGNSSVTTETLGTTDADFVRYNAIDISSRNSAKQNFDNVLNVWGKRQPPKDDPQPASFLNDALFVAVPFGNLTSDQRKQLKDEINKVNLYQIAKTETKFQNGRPVMNYTIDISPQALVQVLAKYVEITGVGNSKDLDPARYEGASTTQITIQVDLLSRHLNKIEFLESGRTETYGAYNLQQDVSLPTQTIEVDELQNRLTEIEQKMQQSTQPTAQ